MHFPLSKNISRKKQVVAIVSVAVGFIGFTLAYPFLFELLLRAYKALGLLRLPRLVGALLLTIISVAPFLLLLRWLMPYAMGMKGAVPGLEDRLHNQIKDLDNARANLLRATNYLDDMKEEILSNYQRREELSAIVKKLESVSRDSAEELRAKLDAIEIVTKWRHLNKLVIGFLLGILSSLMASIIWSVLSRTLWK